MIVLDTSALMSIVLDEPEAAACIAAIGDEQDIAISAGTVAETLIVAARRNVGDAMGRLIDGLGLEIVPVTEASARRIAQTYDRWGKGVHPAALNLGDCFAYELAKDRKCRLLFVGGDFARTDIEGVI